MHSRARCITQPSQNTPPGSCRPYTSIVSQLLRTASLRVGFPSPSQSLGRLGLSAAANLSVLLHAGHGGVDLAAHWAGGLAAVFGGVLAQRVFLEEGLATLVTRPGRLSGSVPGRRSRSVPGRRSGSGGCCQQADLPRTGGGQQADLSQTGGGQQADLPQTGGGQQTPRGTSCFQSYWVFFVLVSCITSKLMQLQPEPAAPS